MNSIQHYVIKFVNDVRQVSGFLRFPPQYNWNIVESGVKHHKPKPAPYLVNFYGNLFSERRTDSDIHQSPKPTTQTPVADNTNSTRQMPKPDVKQSGTCCTM
jgi:hypothetical protein